MDATFGLRGNMRDNVNRAHLLGSDWADAQSGLT